MDRYRKWAIMVAMGAAVLLAPWQGGAQTREATGMAAEDEALSDSAFQEWLAALRIEARGQGISDATWEAALRDAAPLPRVIELDRRQPEFTMTFWSYVRRLVNAERIERGRALLARHRGLLEDVRGRYGVPPRYLVAFWGLETNFGDGTGSFRAIDALATLAFDRRRSAFFRGELLHALQIIEQGHIEPDAMTGSWAGAMGHMQFMPSTFTRYAVDHTGEGRKDIWNSLPDAFSSAANFLTAMGWQPGEKWGREILLPPDFDLMLASLDRRKTLEQWSALGVRRADGKALPRADMQGSIVLPQGYNGPAFLVYDNFRVILRWNRSVSFALAAGLLADQIVGLPWIANGRNAEHDPLARDQAKEMQRLLNGLGFDAGPEDGLPGRRTRTAIRAFQREYALPPDGYPSPALLQRLRALAGGRGIQDLP